MKKTITLITLFAAILATSTIASNSNNQDGGNPFISGSEELKSCLKDVFGEKDFEAYANRKKRPDSSKMEPCMAKYWGQGDNNNNKANSNNNNNNRDNNNYKANNNNRDNNNNKANNNSSCTIKKPLNIKRSYPSKLTGIRFNWEPRQGEPSWSIRELKLARANIVELSSIYGFDPKSGKLVWDKFGQLSKKQWLCKIGNQINTFKKAGISVILSSESIDVNNAKGVEPTKKEFLPQNALYVLLNEQDALIIELAEVAEKYGVEFLLYNPLNQKQSVLNRIRSKFNGKIHGQINNPFVTRDYLNKNSPPDLSNFDSFGNAIILDDMELKHPGDSKMHLENIEIWKKWIVKAKIQTVFLSEFGFGSGKDGKAITAKWNESKFRRAFKHWINKNVAGMSNGIVFLPTMDGSDKEILTQLMVEYAKQN
jgi:hypothetical protein